MRRGAGACKQKSGFRLPRYFAALCLTPRTLHSNHRFIVGDVLQGAAADCNSAEETLAWFDSRVAHHYSLKSLDFLKNGGVCLRIA